jgi:ribosome biogenesis GTPase A
MPQVQWFPGHMSKTLKELKEEVKKVDIVFELVDARIPISSRNPEIEKIIQNKYHLIILNKCDLANPEKTKRWKEYFKSQGIYSIEIDSLKKKNINKISNLAYEILKPLNEKRKAKGLKEASVKALIVGIPNVGKSTLINALNNKKSCKTGDKPGVTKTNQWIKVNEKLNLLDTPGVLWPKFENKDAGLKLSLIGSIKDDILPLDEVVHFGFKYLYDNHKKQFFEKYSFEIEEFDINTIYYKIAEKRGCFLKNQIADIERINRLFLKDFRSNCFGGITLDEE